MTSYRGRGGRAHREATGFYHSSRQTAPPVHAERGPRSPDPFWWWAQDRFKSVPAYLLLVSRRITFHQRRRSPGTLRVRPPCLRTARARGTWSFLQRRKLCAVNTHHCFPYWPYVVRKTTPVDVATPGLRPWDFSISHLLAPCLRSGACSQGPIQLSLQTVLMPMHRTRERSRTRSGGGERMVRGNTWCRAIRKQPRWRGRRNFSRSSHNNRETKSLRSTHARISWNNTKCPRLGGTTTT